MIRDNDKLIITQFPICLKMFHYHRQMKFLAVSSALKVWNPKSQCVNPNPTVPTEKNQQAIETLVAFFSSQKSQWKALLHKDACIC